jgi:hypothetical protein
MKISPVGAELFHAERQTEGQRDGHDKANSGFRSLANAPKNYKHKSFYMIYK